MIRKDLTIKSWSDYELIDSGHNRKLERFGDVVLIRPETQAIWSPQEAKDWAKADAEFKWSEGKGMWRIKNVPDSWVGNWNDTSYILRLTNFKHTGIFPEQAANWEWLKVQVDNLRKKNQNPPNVLNLFGYTGIASVVMALCGARVTHLDASRQSNVWAKENAEASGVEGGIIRYILDDAFKFVEREGRRGIKYDVIVLDPPAFGRGPKGEVWKIEEKLPQLLNTLTQILSDKKGSALLLNGYAAGYAPLSFAQMTEGSFGAREKGEYGEIQISESRSKRMLPSGIYARFVI